MKTIIAARARLSSRTPGALALFPAGPALGGLLALALVPAFWPGNAAAHTCDDPFSTDLIAGRTIDAGNVEVCNDDATLTVTYEATYPWCLLATDLHVARSESDIPQTPTGNPTPDEFADGDEHDCAGTAAFEIPLDDIDGGVSPGDTVVIAAHAEVEDDTGRAEGAWGEGTRFVERGNWVMYFTYAVQEPFLCGGETSKCVFVTSTTHTGNLGGLAGGDAICQARAEAAGSLAAPGTYKAWLSDATASPSTRFTQASVPYKLVDGTTIADDWADLTDGSLDAAIGRTEQNTAPSVDAAWTGTTAQGLAASSNCQGWTTDAISTHGANGQANLSSRGWSFTGTATCFFSFSLYCFQQ